ncbi:hypothetical protein [Actinophytocola sp.]|uniref:hypothetical protein n=1 Tax=Actinophytocola sp. TaxID=1872138 RepID=UPI002D585D61|nr:hypothetical protein [Actinophytocola sp.]HYQ63557.1 hypothetical protein [Actinophytocola sp.]
MAGTNARRAKRALLDSVASWLAADETTTEVTVTYGYRGHEHGRELVHTDRVFGQQSYPVMGGSRARFKRDETLTIKLNVVVDIPGGDQDEAEARATAIGAVIENNIAATASLAGYEPGEVIWVGVTAVDLDSDADDDGALAVLTYDVGANFRLS